ncbi:MAG TPA: hypothetical protein VFA02_05085 [Pseudacidobacterium sp.]|jgi:hypothetical protein|nr:hypothetical protein [Pseudacidobacterium sp.]
MPGFLIQQGATVMCSHGGQAQPTVPNASVTIDGMPSLLVTSPWVVAGCPLVPPPIPPCVTAQWITGTTRVTSFGQPLLVQSGTSICAPTGTPLVPVVTQTRVSAM